MPSAAAGRQEAGAAGSGTDHSDFILGAVATNPSRLCALEGMLWAFVAWQCRIPWLY